MEPFELFVVQDWWCWPRKWGGGGGEGADGPKEHGLLGCTGVMSSFKLQINALFLWHQEKSVNYVGATCERIFCFVGLIA